MDKEREKVTDEDNKSFPVVFQRAVSSYNRKKTGMFEAFMNLLSQYHPDICLYTDEEHLISGYPQGFEQVPPGYKPDAVELTLNEVAWFT
jgi:hypothetical protein